MDPTATKNETIRAYLGHGVNGCKVRITRSGDVHRWGNPDPYNHDKDYWHYVGTVNETLREIAEFMGLKRP